MRAILPLEASLGELLYDLCSEDERETLEREVDLLIARYAPTGSKAELTAASLALGATGDIPPEVRPRLRLWAAALRHRAEAMT